MKKEMSFQEASEYGHRVLKAAEKKQETPAGMLPIEKFLVVSFLVAVTLFTIMFVPLPIIILGVLVGLLVVAIMILLNMKKQPEEEC